MFCFAAYDLPIWKPLAKVVCLGSKTHMSAQLLCTLARLHPRVLTCQDFGYLHDASDRLLAKSHGGSLGTICRWLSNTTFSWSLAFERMPKASAGRFSSSVASDISTLRSDPSQQPRCTRKNTSSLSMPS